MCVALTVRGWRKHTCGQSSSEVRWGSFLLRGWNRLLGSKNLCCFLHICSNTFSKFVFLEVFFEITWQIEHVRVQGPCANGPIFISPRSTLLNYGSHIRCNHCKSTGKSTTYCLRSLSCLVLYMCVECVELAPVSR